MEMNIRVLYILAETLIQITSLFPVGEELIPVIQISSGFAFFFDQFYRFTCLSQPVGCLTSCGSCTYNDNTHIICFSFYIRLFTMECVISGNVSQELDDNKQQEVQNEDQ